MTRSPCKQNKLCFPSKFIVWEEIHPLKSNIFLHADLPIDNVRQQTLRPELTFTDLEKFLSSNYSLFAVEGDW